MTDEPERNFLEEARSILAGHSTFASIVAKHHLEALVEHAECERIKVANVLEKLKQDLLNGRM
jgi:hypothetical protein